MIKKKSKLKRRLSLFTTWAGHYKAHRKTCGALYSVIIASRFTYLLIK
jgi:hypothetical protein